MQSLPQFDGDNSTRIKDNIYLWNPTERLHNEFVFMRFNRPQESECGGVAVTEGVGGTNVSLNKKPTKDG